jgi:membrane-bound lytic murein transglycosylase D
MLKPKARLPFKIVVSMLLCVSIAKADSLQTDQYILASINMGIFENPPEKGAEIKGTLEKIVLFSDEITFFDENQIPTDEGLFNFHINQIEFEIPMVFNLSVKDQINFFGIRWQSKLKKMIRESEYYFPIYHRILDKHDMPLELVYLSIIESALNPAATSRSGAAGLWQFMPATGKMYKLEQNRYIDERRDIEKSTEAACLYLKRMYNHYGDWLLAIASYNCGPGNVNKAMRNSGGSDFWSIYDHLPKETQHYVPKFIAMAYLMNFYSDFGIIPAMSVDDKEVCVGVLCEKTMDIKVICEKLAISEEDIKKYNPGLKSNTIPSMPDPLNLYIPASKLNLFYAQLEDITSESETAVPVRNTTTHLVKKGESLPVIARKYGCSVSELKKWNNLASNTIHPNQRLKIN